MTRDLGTYMNQLLAVDGDRECGADLAHARVRQSAKPVDKHCHRHTFDRVQVDGRTAGDGVVIGFEHDFAG